MQTLSETISNDVCLNNTAQSCHSSANTSTNDLAFELFASTSGASSSPNGMSDPLESGARKQFTLWTDCLLEEREKLLQTRSAGFMFGVTPIPPNKRKMDPTGRVHAMPIGPPTASNIFNSQKKLPKDLKPKIKKIKDKDKNENELAISLGKVLSEVRVDILFKIVKVIGEKLSIDLSNEALAIHANGGMLTETGKPRTKGGIFFQLVKQKGNLRDVHKRYIFYQPSSQMSESKKKRKNEKKKLKQLLGNMNKKLENCTIDESQPQKEEQNTQSLEQPKV